MEKFNYWSFFLEIQVGFTQRYPSPEYNLCSLENFIKKFIASDEIEELNRDWKKIFRMIRNKYEQIYPFLKRTQVTKFNQLAKKPFGKIAETYGDEITKIAENLGKDEYSIIKYLENFEKSEYYYVIQILLHVKYISRPQLAKACKDLFTTLCVYQDQIVNGNFGLYIPISEMVMKGSHTILNGRDPLEAKGIDERNITFQCDILHRFGSRGDRMEVLQKRFQDMQDRIQKILKEFRRREKKIRKSIKKIKLPSLEEDIRKMREEILAELSSLKKTIEI